MVGPLYFFISLDSASGDPNNCGLKIFGEKILEIFKRQKLN